MRFAPHEPGGWPITWNSLLVNNLEAVPLIQRHIELIGAFEVGSHPLFIADSGTVLE